MQHKPFGWYVVVWSGATDRAQSFGPYSTLERAAYAVQALSATPRWYGQAFTVVEADA